MMKLKIAGSASGSESGSICQRHGSADPDPNPHQNVRIRNTEGGEVTILIQVAVFTNFPKIVVNASYRQQIQQLVVALLKV
jgi:hypothetical protein